MNIKGSFAALLLTATLSGTANAAIVSGFNAQTLPANDDNSTGLVDIGFSIDFFGVDYTQLFVNNNGNVTFGEALSAFTPFDLTSTETPIIAPFFADIDTRAGGSPVTYGTGTFQDRNTFGVNWIDVNYYRATADSTNRNSFQLLLVDRSDTGAGNFDIVFNYEQIQWESGTESGGNRDGLGGNSARAGFSNGTRLPGSFFELTGSAVNGAFLDGGPNALVSNRFNSDIDGRYVFSARNGNIDVEPVPAPASVALFALGLFGLAFARKRK